MRAVGERRRRRRPPAVPGTRAAGGSGLLVVNATDCSRYASAPLCLGSVLPVFAQPGARAAGGSGLLVVNATDCNRHIATFVFGSVVGPFAQSAVRRSSGMHGTDAMFRRLTAENADCIVTHGLLQSVYRHPSMLRARWGRSRSPRQSSNRGLPGMRARCSRKPRSESRGKRHSARMLNSCKA